MLKSFNTIFAWNKKKTVIYNKILVFGKIVLKEYIEQSSIILCLPQSQMNAIMVEF